VTPSNSVTTILYKLVEFCVSSDNRERESAVMSRWVKKEKGGSTRQEEGAFNKISMNLYVNLANHILSGILYSIR